MSVKSSLVTCPSDSTMKGYRIADIPSTVSENTLVVDEKADKLYQSISSDYDKVIREFGNISDEYTKASKFAKGKMRKAYVKVAKKCSDQANYCKRRKKNLEDSYSFSKTQGAVSRLEEAIGTEKVDVDGSIIYNPPKTPTTPKTTTPATPTQAEQEAARWGSNEEQGKKELEREKGQKTAKEEAARWGSNKEQGVQETGREQIKDMIKGLQDIFK